VWQFDLNSEHIIHVMNIDSSSHQKKTQKNVLKQQKTTGQKNILHF